MSTPAGRRWPNGWFARPEFSWACFVDEGLRICRLAQLQAGVVKKVLGKAGFHEKLRCICCEPDDFQMGEGVANEVLGGAHSGKTCCAIVGCDDSDIIEERRWSTFNALMGWQKLSV
jgi:hypothetical protein